MNRALQRYVEAASGWTELTTAKAEQVIRQLVRSGEAAGDQVGELVEDLLERQRKNREAASALVRSETVRAVHKMGLASSEEVDRLQKQVADLKRELHRVQREAGVGGSGAAKKTAKKGTKKATKKGTKKATKKATKKGTKKATKKAAKKTAKKGTKKATKKTTGGGSS